MARVAAPEDVNQIVQVDPPFSGHRSGILREMGDHPAQNGSTFHKIDFGEGRAEMLIDWNVVVLEEGETADDVFPGSTETDQAVKSGMRKGRKNPPKEKTAPAPKAPTGPAVRGPNGEIPPGYRESVLGTGKLTKSFFHPGEDATAKSMLLKVERGLMRRSELPQSLVEFVQTNEKWQRNFGHILAVKDDHYDQTQRLKAEAAKKTESTPAEEQAQA